MTALGDVLELLYDPRPRFLTVRAAGRVPAGVNGRQRLALFWWERPDRKRNESAGMVTVERGRQWWTYNAVVGGQSSQPGEAQMGPGALEALMHTRSMLGAELELRSETTIAGRRAVVVMARPCGGRSVLPVSRSDEELEVALDAATGVALRVMTGWGVVEIDEIAFDEVLPDALFQSPIPPGAVMRSSPTPEREVDVDELRSGAPFPLLLPTVLPAGARLLTCSIDGAEHPVWTTLTYVVDPGAYLVVTIRQGPALDPDAATFAQVEVVDGVEIEVYESDRPLRCQAVRNHGEHRASVSVLGPGAPAVARAIAAALEPESR